MNLILWILGIILLTIGISYIYWNEKFKEKIEEFRWSMENQQSGKVAQAVAEELRIYTELMNDFDKSQNNYSSKNYEEIRGCDGEIKGYIKNPKE